MSIECGICEGSVYDGHAADCPKHPDNRRAAAPPAAPEPARELKPCPFCGGEAQRTKYHTFGCTPCAVWMREGYESDWNRRPDTGSHLDSEAVPRMLEKREGSHDYVEGYNDAVKDMRRLADCGEPTKPEGAKP